MRKNTKEYFWKNVEKLGEDDCWKWLSYYNSGGYGQWYFEGSMKMAHKLAYIFTFGDIPECNEPLYVCHDCDNPACCNPKHLFLGRHIDNMRDCIEKGRGNKIGRPKLKR
jgi:hypothetical protein